MLPRAAAVQLRARLNVDAPSTIWDFPRPDYINLLHFLGS